MNDRELLRMAAKASGEITPIWYDNENYFNGVLQRRNPLTDDGDAIRLAVKLGMEVKIDWAKLHVSVWNGYNLWVYEDLSTNSIDTDIEPFSATRRAIVRAAAEIGKEYELDV